MSAAKKEETHVEEWVYNGRRFHGNGVYHQWDDGSDDLRWYDKPLVAGAPVGGRYRVHCGSTTVITGGEKRPVYLGMIEDKEQLLELQLADRAAAHRDAERKQQKRDKDRDLIAEQLLPLRRVMDRRKGRLDKGAMVQAIVAELWRPLDRQERADG